MFIVKSSGFMLTFAAVMPYNRNNKSDKPFKKEYSKPVTDRRKNHDAEDDRAFPGYDPNDKDELAPPRFLAPPPKYDKDKKPVNRDRKIYEKKDSDNSGDRPKRPYIKKEGSDFGDRPKRNYEKRDGSSYSDKPKRNYEKRGGSSFGDKPKKPYEKKDSNSFSDRPKRNYEKRDGSSYSDKPKKPYEKKGSNSFSDRPKRNYEKRDGSSYSDNPKKPYEKKDSNSFSDRPKRNYEKRDGDAKKPFRPNYDPEIKVKKNFNDAPKKTFSERKKELIGDTGNKDDIRLNKYVANSGICSRREADELIAKGMVTVNGKVITEMGFRVKITDTVTFDGKKIIPEPYVYILMNKPKDFLTTTEDDKGRKTVMDLVADKIEQRIFPVGRLDRNTTGVLLLTNDGEVTQALTHPSFEIKKVYQVELDKKVTSTDLDKLVSGIELEDGEAHADGAAFVESDDKRHVGIEIHSGRNRIVRRMFEHLGYEVEKLDRVSFGIFTKKDLPRGKWRHLTQSEVGFLMKLKSKM